MDIIRRNTDYALRTMLQLAANGQKNTASAKEISAKQKIPYQLACKLLQKLQSKKLVKSTMGPNGGYSLRIYPSKITLLKIIEAIQGPLHLNRCLFNPKICPLKKKCPVSAELKKLQNNINSHLKRLTLNDLVRKKRKPKKSRHNKQVKK